MDEIVQLYEFNDKLLNRSQQLLTQASQVSPYSPLRKKLYKRISILLSWSTDTKEKLIKLLDN